MSLSEFPLLGETAALITAVVFAFTATIFTFAGRMLGSETVNRMRLLLAFLLLTLIHLVLYGAPTPWQAGSARWTWLGLSGVIGLALGDAALFQSFLMIGPRLGMLLMSLAPVLAALLGWVFLGERLEPAHLAGIGLTLAGVTWVVMERREPDKLPPTPALNPEARPVRRLQLPASAQEPRRFSIGLLLGLLAATGQAVGMILAKVGLADGFPPISGNLIRITSAAAFIWMVDALRGKIPASVERLRAHPSSGWLLLAGAVTGPVVGVSFSLLAIQNTSVGVASTLIATTPLFMLPIAFFVFKDRFGWHAIIGTLLSIAGIALLFSG